MAKFTKWITQAIGSLTDPDKEVRIQVLVSAIEMGIAEERQRFSLAKAIQGMEYKAPDLEEARERVFSSILARGWEDDRLTSGEQEVAAWVANCLEISDSRAHEINLEIARNRFSIALAQAMEDGILESHEADRLEAIASSVGHSASQFVRGFFASEGAKFMRSMFLACVQDNQICQQDWDYLVWAMQKLGVTHEEFIETIQPQARQFVEHVLADARSDWLLSESESTILRWLVDHLLLPSEYRNYVEGQIKLLATLTQIESGQLPSLTPPGGLETKAGEIVHLYCPAVWRQIRRLKSGPKATDHHGILCLTDHRLMFASQTKSQSITYRRIVSHQGGFESIDIQVQGQPVSTFYLNERTPMPYAIFRSAVTMANQTKTSQSTGTPSRHIPRDVRQRVWQRYGGRCAECGADDYLEFDHVIPVAKGGSNSDSNVQLLCRRCNLKKSDHI